MLDENTILVTCSHGPYLAIAVQANSKEEVEQTLTPLYNHGAFHGEVIFTSDGVGGKAFGYVTGEPSRVIKGLENHFLCLEIQAHLQSGSSKNHKIKLAAREKAAKVWANRRQEQFMSQPENPKPEYSFPKFSNEHE